jgi:hypothetical protein
MLAGLVAEVSDERSFLLAGLDPNQRSARTEICECLHPLFTVDSVVFQTAAVLNVPTPQI